MYKIVLTLLALTIGAYAQTDGGTQSTEILAGRYSTVVITWKEIGSGSYVDEIGETQRYAKNKGASFGEYVVKWERSRTSPNSVLYSGTPCIEFIDADGFVVATVEDCESPAGGQQITQTKYKATGVRVKAYFQSGCAPGYVGSSEGW